RLPCASAHKIGIIPDLCATASRRDFPEAAITAHATTSIFAKVAGSETRHTAPLSVVSMTMVFCQQCRDCHQKLTELRRAPPAIGKNAKSFLTRCGRRVLK